MQPPYPQHRRDKPPKLPPRGESSLYGGHHERPNQLKVCIRLSLNYFINFLFFFFPKPDYDEIDDEARMNIVTRGKSDKGKNLRKYGKTFLTPFYFVMVSSNIFYFV